MSEAINPRSIVAEVFGANGDAAGASPPFPAYLAIRNAHERGWPDDLGPAAFRGVAGEFVRLVDPHTEADPAAVLVQLLVAVGNAAGHHPHVLIGADRHTTNLYAVMVGATSSGRKGTSLGWVRTLVRMADPSWAEREVGNLGSGEVLIWETRDPSTNNKGETDPGVADKRLFCAEAEFASVLRVAGRTGNTLSPMLRQAWDSGDLRHTVKNHPARATGAHVSLIGHVTPDELRRELTRTEMANGLANRVLWCAVKRSKELPRGGSLKPSELEPIARRLAVAIDYSKQVGEAVPDGAFWELWDRVYGDLTAERHGMIGAILGRAAPRCGAWRWCTRCSTARP